MKTKSSIVNVFDVIKLVIGKYGEDSCLIIYPDQSGRIVEGNCSTAPYDTDPLYNFCEISDLVAHLEEK